MTITEIYTLDQMYIDQSLDSLINDIFSNKLNQGPKRLIYKSFCTPESFNTNISYQPFDYTITFLNQQHKNTNSKHDFVLKKCF